MVKPERKRPLGRPDVDRAIILKTYLNSKLKCDGLDCIYIAEDKKS